MGFGEYMNIITLICLSAISEIALNIVFIDFHISRNQTNGTFGDFISYFVSKNSFVIWNPLQKQPLSDSWYIYYLPASKDIIA